MRSHRVRELIGESMREVGVLVGVFVPLDLAIADALTAARIFFTLVSSGAFLIWGIFLQVGWNRRSRS